MIKTCLFLSPVPIPVYCHPNSRKSHICSYIPIPCPVHIATYCKIFGNPRIFTGNIVEVQLYASHGGQFMRMHPVIILAVMMLFSALLGVTGMFLAVPVTAVVKYYLLSAGMPDSILHPLLVWVEGDETGPHKNFVDRHRSSSPEGSFLGPSIAPSEVSGIGGIEFQDSLLGGQ
eukprot:TRINITY_DN14728_c0_g1_i1.p1 TRINITY_DN14728_c0_g1~~TRINITY_DN14728_c0_g1_i1.p1  ORF type:complete len:174 (+),score=6.95 TRINITY_DN14728_c0_g1_i1:105-626(+)